MIIDLLVTSLLLFAEAEGWGKFIDMWDFLSSKDVKSLYDSLEKWSALFAQGHGFNNAWAEYCFQKSTYL